jgi:hypothetical protein
MIMVTVLEKIVYDGRYVADFRGIARNQDVDGDAPTEVLEAVGSIAGEYAPRYQEIRETLSGREQDYASRDLSNELVERVNAYLMLRTLRDFGKRMVAEYNGASVTGATVSAGDEIYYSRQPDGGTVALASEV